MSATSDQHYVATVSVMYGNRLMNDFLRSAGLGLDGVGVWETVIVTYRPGEDVTIDRVKKAFSDVKEASDKARTEFEILSYDIRSLALLPNTNPA